jgi:hypothetical protein
VSKNAIETNRLQVLDSSADGLDSFASEYPDQAAFGTLDRPREPVQRAPLVRDSNILRDRDILQVGAPRRRAPVSSSAVAPKSGISALWMFVACVAVLALGAYGWWSTSDAPFDELDELASIEQADTSVPLLPPPPAPTYTEPRIESTTPSAAPAPPTEFANTERELTTETSAPSIRAEDVSRRAQDVSRDTPAPATPASRRTVEPSPPKAPARTYTYTSPPVRPAPVPAAAAPASATPAPKSYADATTARVPDSPPPPAATAAPTTTPSASVERTPEPVAVREEPKPEPVRAEAPSAAPAAKPSLEVVIPPPADRAAIERVLQAYRDSYAKLDAPSAAVVWPRVDTRALSRAFSSLVQQSVTFDRCDLTVLGAKATAKCVGNIRYVRRVGDQLERVRRLSWTFALERVSADRWQIAQVQTD